MSPSRHPLFSLDDTRHTERMVTWVQFALRFVLGGAIVSLFSFAGQLLKPKTFAGIFSAAPSVALGSLALSRLTHGAEHTVAEGRSMALGSVALLVYSAACAESVRASRWPVWLTTGLCWALWLVTAFSLRGCLLWVTQR